MALSIITLILILGSIAAFGAVRQPDEGAGAHLFQLWFVLEIFLMIIFATKWLPQNPRAALVILALQVIAAAAACAPVYYFRL